MDFHALEQNCMTPAEQIAWHRSEADRIEAEERARRPALAAGQVWRRGEKSEFFLVTVIHHVEKGCFPFILVSVRDGIRWHDDGFGMHDDEFEYVGLARDVLRVVPPDPPAPQVAPEPTGAELVGRRCWVRDAEHEDWRGPVTIHTYIDGDVAFPYRGQGGGRFWAYAEPYVEGVAP